MVFVKMAKEISLLTKCRMIKVNQRTVQTGVSNTKSQCHMFYLTEKLEHSANHTVPRLEGLNITQLCHFMMAVCTCVYSLGNST
jgi:hypothetical protein